MIQSDISSWTKGKLMEEISRLREKIAEHELHSSHLVDSIQVLKDSEQEYRTLLNESSDPIFAFNRDGQYRFVNKAFADGVGKPVESIIHHRIWDVFEKSEADKRFAAVKWVFEHGEMKVIEVRVPRPDGDRYYLTTVKPIFDEENSVISVLCISKEISERKRMEEELLRLSTRDVLTGLYNRNFFEVEMERLQVSRQFPVSIVIADMDYLKGINDRFGHSAGDTLLRKTAECMQKVFRAEDIVARIGGDEFGILLPQTEEQPAQEAVLRLKRTLKETGDDNLRLSIGVSCSGPEGDLAEVMRIADDRMYKEKMSHRIKKTY